MCVKLFIVSKCSSEYQSCHKPGRSARGYVAKGHVARAVRAPSPCSLNCTNPMPVSSSALPGDDATITFYVRSRFSQQTCGLTFGNPPPCMAARPQKSAPWPSRRRRSCWLSSAAQTGRRKLFPIVKNFLEPRRWQITSHPCACSAFGKKRATTAAVAQGATLGGGPGGRIVVPEEGVTARFVQNRTLSHAGAVRRYDA